MWGESLVGSFENKMGWRQTFFMNFPPGAQEKFRILPSRWYWPVVRRRPATLDANSFTRRIENGISHVHDSALLTNQICSFQICASADNIRAPRLWNAFSSFVFRLLQLQGIQTGFRLRLLSRALDALPQALKL